MADCVPARAFQMSANLGPMLNSCGLIAIALTEPCGLSTLSRYETDSCCIR